jgi:hypothetical protein
VKCANRYCNLDNFECDENYDIEYGNLPVALTEDTFRFDLSLNQDGQEDQDEIDDYLDWLKADYDGDVCEKETRCKTDSIGDGDCDADCFNAV